MNQRQYIVDYIVQSAPRGVNTFSVVGTYMYHWNLVMLFDLAFQMKCKYSYVKAA